MKDHRYDDFMALAGDRYACRVYDSARPVDRDTIKQVLEAARIAPSAKNKQPWSFVVLESEEDRRLVTDCYGREWIAGAPVCIVCCAHHDTAWRRADGKDHADIDIAITSEHICLAAAALGLGSCWVCNFNAMQLADALGLDEGVEPAVIIPLGYPAEGMRIPPKNRRPLDEMVRWGK